MQHRSIATTESSQKKGRGKMNTYLVPVTKPFRFDEYIAVKVETPQDAYRQVHDLNRLNNWRRFVDKDTTHYKHFQGDLHVTETIIPEDKRYDTICRLYEQEFLRKGYDTRK